MRHVASVLFVFAVVAGAARADVNVRTCAAEPETTDIAYGDLVNCEINPRSDSDLFRFAGQAGEKIEIYVLRYGGNADQCFRIIDPGGTVGAYSCVASFDFGRQRYVTHGLAVTLTRSGVHTLQVIDGSADETFSYGLVLARVVPLPTAVPIGRFGAILSGNVTPRGDADFYTFTGVAGDTLPITVARLTGNADHCFRLIEPDGAIRDYVCTGSFDFGRQRYASVAADVQLTKSGLHVIEIVDGSYDETFPYNLEVQCFGVCPAQDVGAITSCSYALAPARQVLPAAAAAGSVGVLTAAGCPWAATTAAPHITISSGSTGTGPGTVQFALSANASGPLRTGAINISGQTATITQSGTAPLLIVTPTAAEIRWRQGSDPPSELVASIFTNATSLSYTAAVTAGATWLSVSQAAGTAPGSVALRFNPAALAPGTHQGTVTIGAPTASPATQTIAITLIVEAAGTPQLSVNTDRLLFSFAVGAGQVRRERVPVMNTGGGSLTFTAAAATDGGGNWLTAAKEAGAATLAAPVPVAVSVDPSGLAAGTYTGRVTVAAGTAVRTIPVTVTVSAVRQTILLSQSGLTFTAVALGGSVPPQNFGILNTGEGAMDWTVAASTAQGGNWLSVSPAAGTTDASTLNVPLVNVAVDAAGLEPGQYSAQIEVRSSTANNSPQFVSVVLDVLPAGSDPGPVVRPTGLIFTEAAGGVPAGSQKITVTNLTATQRVFTTGRLTIDGANWFTVAPAGGTVTPSQPVEVTVAVSSAGLTPGIRRGVLTLLFQDGSVRTVNILYVLAAGGVSSKVSTADGCAPTKLLPLVTSLGPQFTVPAAWPNALEAQVVDDCGNPHVNGSVVAAFSNGDAPLPLVSLKNGRWSGTWQARNTDARLIVVTVTADDAELKITGAATVSGGIQASADSPSIAAAAVLSSASYAALAPLAPGGMVSIFGNNLADADRVAANLPLGCKIGETLVTIGGKCAPLVFVSRKQINALIPYGLAVNTRTQVVVRHGNTYTVPESITLAAAQPGFFTTTQDGKGQAIAVKPDGNLAAPGTPARAGETLVFYCAGLGETSPGASDGAATPLSPLHHISDRRVTIGGREAEVQFAGLVPKFVGLYQVNATVPQGVTPGDAVGVVLTVAGQSSPPATIAVR